MTIQDQIKAKWPDLPTSEVESWNWATSAAPFEMPELEFAVRFALMIEGMAADLDGGVSVTKLYALAGSAPPRSDRSGKVPNLSTFKAICRAARIRGWGEVADRWAEVDAVEVERRLGGWVET